MEKRLAVSGVGFRNNDSQEWFAASVILYFEMNSKIRQSLYAWENVYLLLARNGQEAARRAATLARKECYPSVRMIKFRGRWAKIRFGGVRKVAYCMLPSTVTPDRDEVIADGIEATHSTFRLKSKRALKLLIEGRPVNLRYEE